MKPIIRVENVGKRYRIGTRGAAYGTLRDLIAGTVQSSLRGQRNGNRSMTNTFWALQKIDFEVEPGEIVGVIGRNGAGKSTLLKLLSRVSRPTVGRIELYGRLGSLLEVGTGFHPELTGRENIYLNGAILGMKRAEIKRKFDEIVAFAEVERFIETPVKHYSSGMYLRLAFAVASQLEPEILLIDEVLAVGDATFQRKCLGKIGEVARAGRTVIFVSHNMTAVNQLCSRTIMLAGGQITAIGSTKQVVADYLSTASGGAEALWDDPLRAPGNDRLRLRAVRVISRNVSTELVDIDQAVTIEVEFWNLMSGARHICANIYLMDALGNAVLSTGNTDMANLADDDWYEEPHPAGLYRATCTLPPNFLNDGRYYVTAYLLSLGPLTVEAEAPQAISFEVFDTGVMRQPGGGTGKWVGAVRPRLPWRTVMVEPPEVSAEQNLTVPVAS